MSTLAIMTIAVCSMVVINKVIETVAEALRARRSWERLRLQRTEDREVHS